MTVARIVAGRRANRADRKSNADRRRTEEAIRSSKQLLQSVIDSTPDWIQVKDTRHRFILVNRSFANALGQTPEDMIGRLDSEFLTQHLGGDVEAKLADIRARDAAALAGESMHDDREEIVLKDGQRRIFDLFKGPLRDASGAIYGVLTFRRDITERCLYEQDQRALAEQLRQAQKMEVIGHLTGGIAHDFNNILTAIFGFAELALLAPAVEYEPSLSRYLQRIVEAAARARDLVAQLLTFSHKRGVAADESSVIAPIVNEVTQLLRSTTPATISINASVDENLPDVLISSIQLHQVLMNLGINASDAIGAKGSIEIRAARADVATATCASCHRSFGGPTVMITVKDSGSGIREENLAKIFDPFFSTKEIGKGTGLGLSVLHGIVHSASGHVLVHSRPGEGAEFQVYLPYKPDAAARSPQHAAAAAELEQVQGRVLLVDDEPDILEFMSALLESIGCSVIAATGSAEAWKVFSANPQAIDLVVTDQTMPDMTGAELARAMLAQRGDLPILLSTGYSTEIDEAAASAIGIRRLLRKPVPSRVLCELVARYLKRPGGAG